jgi:hypothetical protein
MNWSVNRPYPQQKRPLPLADRKGDFHLVRDLRRWLRDSDRRIDLRSCDTPVAAHWIAVGAIALLGIAILKGVQATRGKDLP